MMRTVEGHVQRGTMRSCPNCGNTFDEAISFCPTDGAKLATTGDQTGDDDPFIGRMVGGRYRLESRLGSGGMGTVYRALHVLMEKPVAVKVLRGELATDETAVARFQREAKGASRIEHENCVLVTDFGREDDGVLWLVMEHLEGDTLFEVIQENGPLPLRRSLDIATQVARALVAAHAVGVVHRDLKPENIMVVQRADRADHAKVLDFGLAKLVHGDGEEALTALTRAGAVFGTPRYMSPEQAQGRSADARSDLYSFGVILYEMVTGTLPFEDDSVVALLNRHVNDKPELPSERLHETSQGRREVDPRLEGIILRCLQKAPEHRFDDARLLLTDLEELADLAAGSSRASARSPARSPAPSLATGEMISVSVQTGPRRRLAFAMGICLGGAAVAAAAVLMLNGEDPAGDPASVPPPARRPASAMVGPPAPLARPSPTPPVAAPPAPLPTEPAPAANAPSKRRQRPKRKVKAAAKPAVPAVPALPAVRAKPATPVAPTAPSPPPADATLSEVVFDVKGGSLKRDGVKVAPTVKPEVDEEDAAPEPKAKLPPPPPPPPRKTPTAPPTPAAKLKPKAPPAPKPAGNDYERGLVYLREGDLRQAQRLFTQAVRERPRDVRIHLALSDLFVQKGDLPHAEMAVRKALKIDPESVPALNRRGRIEYKKGDRKAALRTFRTVVQFKPGDRTALKYIEKLR